MEQDWFLYSLTFFTFAVIFGLCYIRHKFTFFERIKMLSASFPNFPFGNIYDVVFKKTPMFMLLWKFYNKFKRRKCKFGGFYVFLNPSVIVLDTEFTKTLLSPNNDYFQEDIVKKYSDFNRKFSDKMLSNIFNSFLNYWPSLTSLCENLKSEEINLSQVIDQYVMEVSERGLFCFKESSKEFEGVIKRIITEKNVFANSHKFIKGIFTSNKYKSTYANHVEQISKERERHSVEKDDVLQVLFETKLSDMEVVECIFDLIYNLQVLTNLILLSLYELSLNNEIQEDLRGEILRFKKTKMILSTEDLDELRYLGTVIQEILRKYPFKPYVYKVCTKNYVHSNNLKFSKDMLLFIPTFAVHHDPQNYVNPELFDPDRFSEENEKFINPIKYLPFGFHSKEDFDFRFATVLMKLLLMEFLSKYKISLSKKSPRSLRFDEATFEIKSKDDMWFKLENL